MRDLTINIVKSDEGYHVVTVDNAITEQNKDGWKSNDSEVTAKTRDDLRTHIQGLIDKLE